MKSLRGIASIIGVVILAVVVAMIFQKRIKTMFNSRKELKQIKDERKFLEDLGMKLSYPKSWYTSNAQKLYEAVHYSWSDWNCDETGTQRILMDLNNDLDYMELFVAFGVKDSWDLTNWIYGCLNQEEINTVNQNWLTKGITKRL